jgi:predicted 3-demethylubiquinone-9 3-methyltransferase (glyoxalase superfamily)
MTVAFELEGAPFVALNGGPKFPFTEAVSFVVKCEMQEKSMITGKNSPPAAGRKCNAAG